MLILVIAIFNCFVGLSSICKETAKKRESLRLPIIRQNSKAQRESLTCLILDPSSDLHENKQP